MSPFVGLRERFRAGVRAATGLGLCLAFLGGCAAAAPPAASILSGSDREQIAATRQTALESSKVGEGVNWSNAETGHLGTVTPTRTYYATSGKPCREYQETVTVEGKTHIYFGAACRDAEGVWKDEASSAYDKHRYTPAARYYSYPDYYDYYPPIHPGYPYHPYFLGGYGYRPYGHSFGYGYGYGRRFYGRGHRGHVGFYSSFGY